LLESLIKATGHEKNILRHDLYAAVNRYEITQDDAEMEDLTRDQYLMYLIIVGAKRGDPLWLQIEKQLGETIP
jgi:hypothetical protein